MVYVLYISDYDDDDDDDDVNDVHIQNMIWYMHMICYYNVFWHIYMK